MQISIPAHRLMFIHKERGSTDVRHHFHFGLEMYKSFRNVNKKDQS
ncbi:hypothetical protein SLEP1_g15069 [Rubroshorea leprosula]|uniref:Uncharacterized protein n=1 Tax=Rubroshorea leprosula TaxID=152421 RepID=A0AAV5IVM3_9ROSI|nr:hypothetical protein SLEP1_g15069 [Rubroshorea leprosula]